MNLNRIVNMVVRVVMRQAINLGIMKGIDLAARRGKSADQIAQSDPKTRREVAETTKRARRLARLARRIGRF